MQPTSRSLLACLTGLALAAAPGHADVLDFVIALDGPQTGTDSPGFGAGTATLDTDTLMLTWDVSFEGLVAEETAAHFHGPAPICESAGIEIPLPLGARKVGAEVITPQQAADLQAGLWYINIHSATFPPGEIRGQVVPPNAGQPIPDVITPSDVHVRLQTIARGLVAPNWGTCAPGDPSRMFVTDQAGTLWAIDTATGAKSVFLDVSGMITPLGVFGPGTFDERGLLGVAFHPDYPDNGQLYTYTSEPADAPADFSTIPAGISADHQTVIRAWTVPSPGDTASIVDPATTRVLVRIDQPQFNHNAGAIAFGHDRMLHIALGDGGGADDQDGQPSLGAAMIGHGCMGNGQDTTNVLGSVLRIDVDGNDAANGQYGIPGDNPFLGDDDAVDEIFAFGFRNPFRFSFDMATGDLYLADVGQNHVEEVNVVTSGGNYGWNAKEGTFPFVPFGVQPGFARDDPALRVPPDLIDPIAEYDHDEGIAIVGGFVYRGAIAPLQGSYVFGEFAQTFGNDGRLFHLDDAGVIRELNLVDAPVFGRSLLGFGQDANGEVYVMANGTGTPDGSTGVVMRIETLVGDFDASGATGFADVTTLLAAWGSSCPSPCGLDLNGDGSVGFADLSILLVSIQ